LHPNLALLRNCERNNLRSSAMNHESNCVLLTPAHVASSRLPMFWIACAELFGYDHGHRGPLPVCEEAICASP